MSVDRLNYVIFKPDEMRLRFNEFLIINKLNSFDKASFQFDPENMLKENISS